MLSERLRSLQAVDLRAISLRHMKISWILFYAIIGLLIFISQLHSASAHGFGDRADLPVPPYLYWFGGGAAVVASFVVISLFVGRSNVNNDYKTYNILKHSRIKKLSESNIFLTLVRLPPVGLLFLVILAGLFGTRFPDLNFAPTFVWVIWWVGFGFLHVLVGNIWAVVNPWKSIFGWARLDKREGIFEYPRRLGVWPAFLLFFTFVWIELVFPGAADPRSLALLTIGYSAVVLSGMYLFGKSMWLRYGEPFSVFFGFLSMFAPTEIRVKNGMTCEECVIGCKAEDGWCINCYDCADEESSSKREINVRPFAVGLLRGEMRFDQASFVILMLSSVSFDGLINTLTWYDFLGIDPFGGGGRLAILQFNTIGLIGTFGLFVGIYYSFIYLAKRVSGFDRSANYLALLFIVSLLPIAMVYQFAHYSTFLFINGQQIINLISDPFGYQWDLFGTRNYTGIKSLDFLAVWNYQVLVIVLGHIAAVYTAHRISLRVFDSHKRAIKSQYPIMLLMVTYTVVGLWLLSIPSIG